MALIYQTRPPNYSARDIQSLTVSNKMIITLCQTSDMILNPMFYLEKVCDYTSVLCCLIGVVLHLTAKISKMEVLVIDISTHCISYAQVILEKSTRKS